MFIVCVKRKLILDELEPNLARGNNSFFGSWWLWSLSLILSLGIYYSMYILTHPFTPKMENFTSILSMIGQPAFLDWDEATLERASLWADYLDGEDQSPNRENDNPDGQFHKLQLCHEILHSPLLPCHPLADVFIEYVLVGGRERVLTTVEKIIEREAACVVSGSMVQQVAGKGELQNVTYANLKSRAFVAVGGIGFFWSAFNKRMAPSP